MRTIPVLLALTFFSAVAVATEEPSSKQAAAAAHAKAPVPAPHTGKVLGSIDASIYTYIEISDGGKTLWLATPTTKVNKDDMIGYDDGPVMNNFFSKTLNRTFDTVVFVSKVVVVK